MPPIARPRALMASAFALALAPHLLHAATSLNNGRLNISTGSGNTELQVRVGPTVGAVTVSGLPGSPAPRTFFGVTSIALSTGAGSDRLSFEIDAPQSLALRIDTGSGDAETNILWNVPAAAVTPVLTLAQISAGGATRTALDLRSAAPDLRFGWTQRGGGGSKQVDAKMAFLPGSQRVVNDVAFQLGGGLHDVAFDIDSDAADYALTATPGATRQFSTKLVSDAPSERLAVAIDAGAPKTEVDLTSAARSVDLDLAGLFAPTTNEAKYVLTQVRPGASVDVTFSPRGGAANDKFDVKLDGQGSRLHLAGAVQTALGQDELFLESSFDTTVQEFVANLGGGDDTAALAFKGPLTSLLPASPRLVGGDGNDALGIFADLGVNGAVPRIVCGAGIDAASGVGDRVGCEQ